MPSHIHLNLFQGYAAVDGSAGSFEHPLRDYVFYQNLDSPISLRRHFRGHQRRRRGMGRADRRYLPDAHLAMVAYIPSTQQNPTSDNM